MWVGDNPSIDKKKICYLNQENLLREGVSLEITKEQAAELKKVGKNIDYFVQNYVKIVTLDKGVQLMKLRDYQKEFINTCYSNRFVISMMARQMGKTTTVVAYLLHQAITRSNIRIAILANKGETAKEVLDRLKMAYEALPFYMQVGVKEWNKNSITLGNGTKILAAATSSASIRGKSCNIIYLDEFAHVDNDIDFYTSTYPVISSGKTSQVIITSTPNGLNLFHKMWVDATSKRSKYVPLKYNWRANKEYNEKWYEDTIANISPQQFAQEYECVSGDTIITLRHGKHGRKINIPIGDVFRDMTYSIGEYEILTDTGFSRFDKIVNRGVKRVYKMETENYTLTCTDNHKFYTQRGWKTINELGSYDKLLTTSGYESIVRITNAGKQAVYDALNVRSNNRYYTNGILSHNCEFLGSSLTLLSGEALQKLVMLDPDPDLSNRHLSVYNDKQEGHNYVITVDVAEGVGLDSSVVSVFDVTQTPYKHVACYKNNMIQPIMLIDVIFQLATHYNNAHIAVENNSIGSGVVSSLWYEYEYENIICYDAKTGDIRFNPKALGVRTTHKTKSLGCSALKSLVESGNLITNDISAIGEFGTFTLNGKTYKADTGKHDDVVMTLVMFALLSTTAYFKDMFNDSTAHIKAGIMANDNNDYGFMFVVNGIDQDLEFVDGASLYYA